MTAPKGQLFPKAVKYVKRRWAEWLAMHVGWVSRRIHIAYRPDFETFFDGMNISKDFEKSWIRGVEANNSGDFTRLYSLILNLRRLLDRQIKGSFAELGVYKGNSARIFHQLAPNRRLFLFDTFSGFSKRDLSTEPAKLGLSSFQDTSLEYVKAFVAGNENVVYCPGYFPETAKYVPDDERFAFVHLDCDLYEPMRAGLDYFFPKMTKGGLIAIHDYSNPHWPGVRRAVDDFLAKRGLEIVILPDKSGTAMIPIS